MSKYLARHEKTLPRLAEIFGHSSFVFNRFKRWDFFCVACSFEIRSKIHCGSLQIFLQFFGGFFLVQWERFSSKNNFLDISRLILREQSGKHECQQGAWSAAGCGRLHSTCWGTGLPHLWYDYLVTLRLLTLRQYCTLTQTKHSMVRSSS